MSACIALRSSRLNPCLAWSASSFQPHFSGFTALGCFKARFSSPPTFFIARLRPQGRPAPPRFPRFSFSVLCRLDVVLDLLYPFDPFFVQHGGPWPVAACVARPLRSPLGAQLPPLESTRAVASPAEVLAGPEHIFTPFNSFECVAS